VAEFIAPRQDRDAAWARLVAGIPDGDRAQMISARLACVPFAEGRARGGTMMMSLADLLPAGLPPGTMPAGAAGASAGSGGDFPEHERIDVMIPAGDTAVVHHPFWLFTYRIDYKEHAAAVDAVSGLPAGPAAPPDRWAPAWKSALAGLVVFAVVGTGAAAVLPALAAWPIAGILSWAAAAFFLTREIAKLRARL